MAYGPQCAKAELFADRRVRDNCWRERLVDRWVCKGGAGVRRLPDSYWQERLVDRWACKGKAVGGPLAGRASSAGAGRLQTGALGCNRGTLRG